ncbi:teneurin-m [Caerostris extrusa]|uniref:Teneurin-m n=1 Tax=Caerostris extrusa TaxID=172846 RepID=A0AAV4RD56_CAEEX|nr:teneurin-m [Caerostris extrusa]
MVSGIYSPPQQPTPLPRADANSSIGPVPPIKEIPTGSLHSSTTAATTISATTNNSTGSSNTGATYSNPIPVFSTPSSTTGPMVPIANCVNPQLIQPPTAPPTTDQEDLSKPQLQHFPLQLLWHRPGFISGRTVAGDALGRYQPLFLRW